MPAEHRQHIRFKAFEGASVLVRSKKDQVRGILVDISKSGASFEYVPAGETLKTCVVDIISDNKNFRIEKIPCRTIFEIQLYNEKYTPLKMWRIGVQFEALTFTQCSDLVYFINEYLDYLAPVSTIESNPSLKGKRDMIKLGSAQSEQMQMFLNPCKKRRWHSRKPCEIAINYATRVHALEDVIKNISLGGVYIETRMPLTVGQSISMKFRLPKSRKLIHVIGEIVWADLPGIGVKFRSTAAKDNGVYFNDLKTKPERYRLCLLKMITPSDSIYYVTGWYNNYQDSYEWECNMEDTHHGGYLEAPYNVIEWAYLE